MLLVHNLNWFLITKNQVHEQWRHSGIYFKTLVIWALQRTLNLTLCIFPGSGRSWFDLTDLDVACALSGAALGLGKWSLLPSCGGRWSWHPGVDGLTKASRLYKYGRILLTWYWLCFRATRDRAASPCPRQWFPSPHPVCPTRVWSTPASTLPTTATVSHDCNVFQTCQRSSNCKIILKKVSFFNLSNVAAVFVWLNYQVTE